ncbi:MAG TPA: MBL fold metallo-hydrolase [Thermoplasmata archaeon]|nr:MBL fold metallo-hydrolase [Thermoplasmata archaeon]
MTDSRHYRLEEIGEGIHAAIARPEGFAICNSGILDLHDQAGLVFDTGMNPDSAQDLRGNATRVLGRPPSVAVSSHRHLDHFLGNSEFASVPIWGTRRTREILLETGSEILAEVRREQLEKDIAELESHRGEMPSETARKDLDFNIHLERALLAAAGRVKVVPPDHTFDTRVTIPGPRGAELICLGSGHTEADAFLFLPQEKVLFAGDLVVVGIQPSMGNGDPEHWLEVLDEIERMRPERIIPGHGPVTATEGIEETRGYLSGVLAAARARKGTKLPAAIGKWEGSLSLDWNLKFAREWVKKRDARS